MVQEFEKSKIYVLETPRSLRQYLEVKKLTHLFTDTRYQQEDLAVFMFDLLRILFDNIYEIIDDSHFLDFQLREMIRTCFLLDHVNLILKNESDELLTCLKNSIKELVNVIVYQNIRGANFVVLDVQYLNFTLEVEEKVN